jgi:hypothetical protein
MVHLRSFLESLQACAAVHKRYGGTLPTSWQSASLYLRVNNILSLKEEQIATALYTLISDAAVHPLVAEREYARLMRNISIEVVAFRGSTHPHCSSLRPVCFLVRCSWHG